MSVKIFFCYAREDEQLLNKLKTQLKPLQRQGLIETWHDRDISAGTAWESEINQHLDAAHIILLLVSPDFMDSDYCYGVELQRAIQRHERGEASVIPIILRPVHWYIDPLNALQALPTDAKPVKNWSDLDDAFYNVVGGIRKVVKKHWLEKSNAYYKTKFYGEALQAITQVIRIEARDAQLYKLKGDILHKLGRLEEALAAFEQAILFDPQDAVACCSKGLLLSELGHYEDALRVCEHAIELDTSYAYAYYTKGKALQDLTRYQDALATYEQAIRIDPNNAEAYEHKGQVLHLLKQDTEAVLAYEQAAKLNPTNLGLFNALRTILQDLNKSAPSQSAILTPSPTRSDRDRFDKFTERARKVLSLSQEEAQRFQHNYIGTEHLLLGLICEGGGVAALVLASLGIELNKVRSAVEFIIGRGDRIVIGEIGLTPRSKRVIELAVDEARRLNHHYIGTEHLLLGLVREGEGIAAGVLESLGVKLEKVRTLTIQVLSPPGILQVSSSPIISPELQSALRALDSLLREKEKALQLREYELAAELRDREVKLRDRISKLEALDAVLREKEAAIKQQEYELAAELRDREVKLRDRISKLEKT
jgi:tetratricopeptide (TPR) repeat protein